jgi:predicted transcriptional regulator
MKIVLMSIQPKHLINILYGNKTIEIRKRIPKAFKGWVYLYCTLGGEVLEKSFLGYRTMSQTSFYRNGIGTQLNGTIVARFWFDEYEVFPYGCLDYPVPSPTFEDEDITEIVKCGNGYAVTTEELYKICLLYEELEQYGDKKTLYGLIIKSLEIFSTPKKLKEFNKDKAPQSWCYEEVEE